MAQVTTQDKKWWGSSDDGEGRAVQFHNARAAQAVARALRSTLGPDGMDKMVIDENGDVTITNDGATVLEKLAIDDPFETMIAHVGFAQKSEMGDGTTTAVVIAGELIRGVRDLLSRGIHPTTIVAGFRKASSLTCDELKTSSTSVESEDDPLFEQAIASALAGTVSDAERIALSELLVDVFRRIDGSEEGDYAERIAVTSHPGQRIGDSEIRSGAVIEKSPIVEDMSLDFDDASILLVDAPIELDDSERDLVIDVSGPDRYQQFVDRDSRARRQIVDRIAKAGVDVVFCQKGVDDEIAQLLAKQGIPISRFTPKPDIEFLARLLDSPIVSDLTTEIHDKAGGADIRYTESENTFYLERKDAPAVTFVLRGSTKMVAKELERSITDAIDLGAQLLSDGGVVPGAGAIEIELAGSVRESATKTSGREQLAMETFADALEKIPCILAKNSGFDSIQALSHLRAVHDSGMRNAGIDIHTGDSIDAYASEIVDVAAVKRNAVVSATEAANLVLKVDDVIPATELSQDS
ncbi:thermosome subunit alpha [Haladaptatus caseinilyticus]|uniref:thermosome subunit alpha n=1 Tax=Haladaptatus caseinilyticus TaxID=2993314 RepID=UPI00224B30BE|nr:thermosome subunit alpha [Haladaptatus caseinilyticus]